MRLRLVDSNDGGHIDLDKSGFSEVKAKSTSGIVCFDLNFVFQSINFSFYFCPNQHTKKRKFGSSRQKKETMAKRYTLVHAHEKNFV